MPRDRDRDNDDRRGGGKFKYQKRSRESVRDAANQNSGNYDSIVKDGTKLYKPKDGKNTVRILPPTWEGADYYAYDIWVNYGIGVDQQSYLSLSKMKNKKDPLEEAKREAESEGDKKTSDALTPKKRRGMYVIDRMAEEEGVQFWPCAWTFDKDVANMCVDEDDGSIVYIDDPNKGNDIRFYREGTGRNTKYPASKIKILKTSPLSEDERQQDEWLEYAQENPIPGILLYHDYDHIAAVFGGKVRTKEDEEEEEKNGGRKRRGRDKDDDEDDRKSSKKRSRDEDEDDKPVKRRSRDDDDDDEEKPSKRRSRDEDEDEDKPKRKRTDDDEDEKPRKRRVREEEDEEEDKPKKRRRDEDEDEDDKPAKKRKRDDDDDEEEKPRKKRRDDDDDEEKPKKRRRDDYDDEDEKPRKKRRDDDDEDEDDKRGKAASVKDRLRDMRKKREEKEDRD